MAALTAERAAPPPLTRRRGRQHGGLSPWLFALPALAVYVVFLVYPSLTSLFFSLTDWDGLSPSYNIVGLQNYADLFTANSHVNDRIGDSETVGWMQPNALFMNDGEGHFRDATAESGLTDAVAAHRGCGVADFDGDGRDDGLG